MSKEKTCFDEIELNGEVYIRRDSIPKMAHDFVIVRTRNAGVHCGSLLDANPAGVVLGSARRIWRWRGANTLNELAVRGADTGYTRISEPVPVITLLEACEIIPCSEAAAANLSISRWPN